MTAVSAVVPPQNVEAEAAVLGAMLVADQALDVVLDQVALAGDGFYLNKHRLIFEAIADLHAAYKPADELSVIEELTARGQIEEAGGRHYVAELAATVPAAGNARHYAEIVRQNAELRRTGQALQEAAEAFAGRNGETAADLHPRLVAVLEAAAPSSRVAAESSWHPVDLAEALSGGEDPGPTILTRTDGESLIYRERIVQVAGEPEACKGWLAMTTTSRLLEDGCTVLYLDFESTPTEAVQRLQTLGVPDEWISERFIYLRPHEPLEHGGRAHLEAALDLGPALVVIDGVTEVLTIHGLDLNDNADVAKWLELLPRPAVRTGAAVLMIDHVVKEKEARGRYAIGAQHKLAGIDVAYSLEVIEPFGRGRDGLVKIKVQKDRPGHVRRFADGDSVALMRLHSDPDSGAVSVDLTPPDSTDEDGEFRPTVLMERISRAVEANPGMTVRDIREISGKASTLEEAKKCLVEEGFIEVNSAGRAHSHVSVRPFRKDPSEVAA